MVLFTLIIMIEMIIINSKNIKEDLANSPNISKINIKEGLVFKTLSIVNNLLSRIITTKMESNIIIVDLFLNNRII